LAEVTQRQKIDKKIKPPPVLISPVFSGNRIHHNLFPVDLWRRRQLILP
jgi:hypothetical protein